MVHTIMEAEKSHNLLSASRRPRKACGEIQSKCKSLRTRSQWCRFQFSWEDQRTKSTESKKRSMFHLNSQAGRVQFFFSFYTSPQWIDWCPHTLRQANTSLSPLIQMLISSRNTSQTHSEIIFEQISGNSKIQSNWQAKLTTTIS